MITIGDIVEIIKEHPSRNSRIGHEGKVLRKGIQGMFWLKLIDGKEVVWKGKWLKRKDEKNGNNVGQS